MMLADTIVINTDDESNERRFARKHLKSSGTTRVGE